MTDNQMDALRLATDWAKAESLSSAFFALFGIGFFIAAYCFWHFGKTDTAKAYLIPLCVAGTLLVILGVGLVISNQWRLAGFADGFAADQPAFIAAEIARAETTIKGYNNAIFRVLPGLVLISALALFFVRSPIWQASMIALIAMVAVIMIIDTNATARLSAYQQSLTELANKS